MFSLQFPIFWLNSCQFITAKLITLSTLKAEEKTPMFFVTFYVFDLLGATEESNYLTSLAQKTKLLGDS